MRVRSIGEGWFLTPPHAAAIRPGNRIAVLAGCFSEAYMVSELRGRRLYSAGRPWLSRGLRGLRYHTSRPGRAPKARDPRSMRRQTRTASGREPPGDQGIPRRAYKPSYRFIPRIYLTFPYLSAHIPSKIRACLVHVSIYRCMYL